MERATAVVLNDDLFVLSNLPPTQAQKRLALVVVLAMLVAFIIAAGPLSSIRPGEIAAFVPAYATAMLLSETITSVLLFSQFSILRTRALLVISSGYLFTALMLILWVLTYPFTGKGLFGNLQSTPYIYFYWHIGFPIFVIVYALLKDANPSKRFWRGPASGAIILSVVLTAAAASVAAYLFIVNDTILPRLQLDILHSNSLWLYAGVPTLLLTIITLFVLWIRRSSILDLWLMVSMCAYGIEPWLTYPNRYSFGWYAGKSFGLLSSSLVLLVLLYEITTLYARLLRAVRAQHREREARLMTGDTVAAAIAHEVLQPLSGMITNADAGLRFLNRPMPDLDEAKEAFEEIVAGGHRAAAVISSIRRLFKTEGRNRASFDVNKLIEDTLALVQEDLQKHRISVERQLDARLPQATGDRIQLQQVLLNLMTNGIDAMAGAGGSRILSVRSKVDGEGDVCISVADTGAGIGAQDIARVFNPLFTTKANGMGMGLSICRSIIDAHGGRLWADANEPRGAVFRFSLPSPERSS
jgi:signal transduction histidine kinase